MSPLAEAVYELLRCRVREPDPRITYADLARQLRDLGGEFEYVHHRNRELYTALGEVGQECRRLKVPPLPALVVRADTRRPGAAYYEGRCSGVVHKGDQVAAWRKDLEAVRQTAYPPPGRPSGITPSRAADPAPSSHTHEALHVAGAPAAQRSRSRRLR